MQTRSAWVLSIVALGLVGCSVFDDTTTQANALVPTGNPNGKDDGGECGGANDCKSGVCSTSKCMVPTSADKVKNGQETGLDCGGPKAPPCGGGQACTTTDDCASHSCEDGACGGPAAVATHTDKEKNLDETDVDCGGKTAPPCADERACRGAEDCASKVCSDLYCYVAAIDDGVQNLDETDVDCGGKQAPKCEPTKGCKVDGDCNSDICKADKCQTPSSDDKRKNGDESDVDCGGTTTGAPKCDIGKGCEKHADCQSDACSVGKKCVAFKGCTGHFGGDTCGPEDAAKEDCCTSVAINDRPATQGGPFNLDRFQITAGRMRALLDRYDGNLKAWAATNPPGWNQTWTANLPESYDDANYLLGPYDKRGCRYNGEGGHTFWTDPVDEGGGVKDYSDFTKDVLDQKTLNCVPWFMAQAVCAFDGRRLATQAEIAWSFENRGRAGGPTAYPWQWHDNSAYDPNGGDSRLAHRYSYSTPNPPANLRLVGGAYALDHTFWIAPPGRHPLGVNMYGVEDMAGNVLSWTSDGVRRFTWTMSWEEHNKELASVQTWTAADGPEGYYALGGRCASN